jgi:L-asparaginase II
MVESVHRVHVAVADAAGRLRAHAGDARRRCWARSAIKPMQAVPLVEDGVVERYRFADRELALCCGSHSGEARHVETAAAMLRRVGLEEDALACGGHEPFDAAAAEALRAAGRRPGRLHNNCSGKHAGMLALARRHEWPTAGYHEADHPVQRRMLDELVRWTGLAREDVPVGVDGCGVATFGLGVDALARGFARFGAAARGGQPGPARVLLAMTKWPDYVAGSGRLCTRLLGVSAGRIVAKVGAEGVYAVCVQGAELGIALKVEDGARRASEPALLAVLRALGLLSDDEVGELAAFVSPEVRNTRGERVGEIRVVLELESA